MNYYNILLYFIIFVKISYVISILLQLTNVFNYKYFSDKFYENNDENKEKIENLYIFLMAILIIIIFNNRSKQNYKFSRLELELLFVFGVVLSIKLFVDWLKKFRLNKKQANKTQDVLESIFEFVIPVIKSA
jgi:F0F1-type ATP synthase membrane subunit a